MNAAKDAVKAVPSSHAAQFHLALALILEKKHRKAVRVLEKLKEYPETKSDVLFYSGLAEFELQQYQSSVNRFTDYLLLEPDDAEAMSFVARCYQALVRGSSQQLFNTYICSI